MKKFLSAIIALLLLVSLASCGKTEETQDEPQQETEKESLVYLCQQLGDLSFNDDGWAGCQKVAEEYNMDAQAIELGIDTSTYEAAFLDACDSGKYDYLVTQSNLGLSDYVIKYAGDYPDMKFVCFDIAWGTDVKWDNVTGIAYEQNDGSYLAGMLAAHMSQSGQIGAITGNDVPVINDFFAGYIEGAQSVNPDISIKIAYTNSWDSAKFQEVALAMYQSGIDVIFDLGGVGVWNGCLEAGGLEAGKYIISVDMDKWAMYKDTEPELASVIVTSMLKQVGNSIYKCFTQIKSGEDVWNKVILQGIEENAIGLAKNEYYEQMVPEEIRAKIDESEAKIVSGELNPVSYFDFANYEEFDAFRSAAE